jgi:hypothetical protein
MSIILKIVAIVGFAGSFAVIEDLEAFITTLLSSLAIFAVGVLFKNLGDAFEDIVLIRKRQKLELIHKGIIKEEE